jgi:hypothetical protein
MLIIVSTFALKRESPELTIKNLKELKFEMPDTLTTRNIDLHLNDTLIIKIDSLTNKFYQINNLKDKRK